MNEGGALDIAAWISDYGSYLESSGYAGHKIRSRLKHLNCLQGFIDARAMESPEAFCPELASDFIDYWVSHQPWAKTSKGFSRPSRFAPRHHIAIQYTLHCFFRWAHATGRLQSDIFPRKPAVRGNYFFRSQVAICVFANSTRAWPKTPCCRLSSSCAALTGFSTPDK